MRGIEDPQDNLFSYVSLEDRIPDDHPLRPIRRMVDDALERLSDRLDALYAGEGRPSIPPERLLRASLLQILYSVRSEKLLMEQLQYNLLFRWFVGLGIDDPVWNASTFSKNRDRLLDAELSQELLQAVLGRGKGKHAKIKSAFFQGILPRWERRSSHFTQARWA